MGGETNNDASANEPQASTNKPIMKSV
jgi:hypothetical protein